MDEMKQEKRIWQKTQKELLRDLDCREEGLTAVEARERLATYGPNELRTEKKKNVLLIFLEQFRDLLVVILLLAAADIPFQLIQTLRQFSSLTLTESLFHAFSRQTK